jgi:hypothetical protein
LLLLGQVALFSFYGVDEFLLHVLPCDMLKYILALQLISFLLVFVNC